jgi:hypothetical protein
MPTLKIANPAARAPRTRIGVYAFTAPPSSRYGRHGHADVRL